VRALARGYRTDLEVAPKGLCNRDTAARLPNRALQLSDDPIVAIRSAPGDHGVNRPPSGAAVLTHRPDHRKMTATTAR
jgi:hypothetical protein